jgi:hypothetical protein
VDHICRTIKGVPFSRSWVSRVLTDRSVLGEFQPSGCEVIPNYFPQVISKSEFDAARATMEGKRRNGSGRYIGGNRQKSHLAENLFTGLLFENVSREEDEGPVYRPLHFQSVGSGKYLMSAFDKTRKSNRMRYDVLEKAILRHFTQEDWQAVIGDSQCPEVKQAQAELETVLREIDIVSQRIARTNSAMDDSNLDVATLKVLASRAAKDEGHDTDRAKRRAGCSRGSGEGEV